MRHYIEEQLNAILDVGFASREDTAGFKEIKHDAYVEALQDWLHSYSSNWAEQPNISNLQGLKDRGIDLKAEFKTADCNVGFQIKSYGDIDDKGFSETIWKQIGQSRSYVIDRLYIILCGDMTSRSHYEKVRGFNASVKQGNYPEITIISPEQAWQLYQSFTQPIDAQQVQSRLTNLAKFLHVIGRQQELHTQNSIYFNLERLYVPPTEYSEIKQALETNDIVVIVGAPHLGKTFTAVKLLYEYYLQGYQPYWIFGRIAREDAQSPSLPDIYHRHGVRDSFSLQSKIEPGCIVYVEDPYGSTKQEELEFVHSKRRFEIDDLLRMLKRRSHTVEKRPKVIITSRESIFRRAVQLQPELSKYAIWLKAGMGDKEKGLVSYDFGTRVRITEKYERLYQPLWLQITEDSPDDAKKNVEEILSWAVSILWTPHSIQRFFRTSQNMSWHDVDALKKIAYESANISNSFASEIALLPHMQRLVFVVIYLANYRKTSQTLWDRPSRAYDEYLALVQVLGFSPDDGHDAWSQVIENYATTIEQIESPWKGRLEANLVRFAHPAYDDAVATFSSDTPEVLEDIFAHIRPLLQSQSGTRLAQDMVWLLHHWHKGRPSKEAQVLEDYLTTNDVSLLVRLAEEYVIPYAHTKSKTLKSAIFQILEHPIAKGSNNLVRQVFVITAHIAKNMPMEKRCEVLLAGLGDNPFLIWKARYRPYDLVCRHYDEVTDEAREHLQNYLDSDTNAWKVVGRSLGHYYDCLPQHLQQAATSLATTDTGDSFVARTELIKGLILGFGQFNNSAHHLIDAMSTSDDHKIRAYLASALVLIYDQLDQRLRKRWHYFVENDLNQCTIAGVERIIGLSTEDTLANTLKNNGLFDFALNCAESESPEIRAEMLGILLADQEEIPADNIEEIINNLIQDDAEIVRAATLYWMLSSSNLQAEFPERFQALITDTSVYAKLSKLIFYTNPPDKTSDNLSEEIEELKRTNSQFLYNALLFHVTAQLPFLSSSWDDWLEKEIAKGEDDTDGIVNVGKWHHPADDTTRPIFKPNWLLDYADQVQLIRYHPRKKQLRLSTGAYVIIRDLDELNMIFQLKQRLPDLLVC